MCKKCEEYKICMPFQYSPDVLLRIILNPSSYDQWMPTSDFSIIDQHAENCRVVKRNYGLRPYLFFDDFFLFIKEEWASIAPRDFIILSKTVNKHDDKSPETYLPLNLKIRSVISAIEPTDPSLCSPSNVTITMRLDIPFVFRLFMNPGYYIRIAHLNLLRGMKSYIDSLSKKQLLKVKNASISPKFLKSSELSSTNSAAEVRYRKELRSTMELCLDELDISKDVDYNLLEQKEGVSVWYKSNSAKNEIAFKSSCIMENSANVVVDFLSNVSNKPAYDIMCLSAEQFLQLSIITTVFRQEFRLFWPDSAMDFVCVSSVFVLSRGEYMIISKSISDASFPKVEHYERGVVEYAAYHIKPSEYGNRSLVSFITRCKLSVDIPTLIQQSVIANIGFHLCSVKSLILTLEPSESPSRQELVEFIADTDEINPLEMKNIVSSCEESKHTFSHQNLSHLEILASQNLDRIWEASRNDSWKFVEESNGVKIFKRDSISPTAPFVMGTGVVNCSPLILLALVKDVSKKKLWDSMFEKGHKVEDISPFVSIDYQKYKAVWPTDSRDFCNLNSYRINEDGSVIAGGSSIQHPSCPETKGCIRANLILGGMVVVPISGNKSHVSYLINLDLCGSIPSMIINIISIRQPQIVSALRSALENMDTKKMLVEASNNIQKHWTSFQKSQHQSAKTDENRLSLDLKDDPEGQYDKIGEDIIQTLIDIEQDSNWEFIQKQDDVKLYSKKPEAESLPIMMGVGMVEGTPWELLAFIADEKNKTSWDSLYDSGNEVIRVDEVTRIMNERFKAIWPTSPRDFCNIVTFRVLKEGSIVVAAKSIEHSLCPPSSKYIRAKVIIGGFIFKPIDSQVSEVKYIVQTDLQGSLPALVTNKVSKSQPLIVNAIRRSFSILREDAKLKENLQLAQDRWSNFCNRSDKFGRNNSYGIPESQQDLTAENPFEHHLDCEKSFPERNLQCLRYLGVASEAFSLLLEAYDSRIPYQPLFEKHNVKVSQFVSRNKRNLPTIRGETVILNAHAHDIASIVISMERRRWYDFYFSDGSTVEIVDANTRVNHAIFEATDLCRGTSREFLVVDHWRQLPDGKYVVVSRSIEHPNLPISQSITRSHVEFAGFVIEPIESDTSISIPKNFAPSCKVTYITQVDLRGSLPNWISSLMVKQQPMVLQMLQKLFR